MKTYGNRVLAALAAALYVGCIFGANWMIGHVGQQPAPGAPHMLAVDFGAFGLMAPSGVLLVGPALALRDYVQWVLGKPVMLACLLLGVIASYLIADPTIALASAAAFGLSELVDFAGFTALSPRWLWAVLVGGALGAVVDSFVFLTLAFGSLDFMTGQVAGKLWGVALGMGVVALRRRSPGRRVAVPVPAST